MREVKTIIHISDIHVRKMMRHSEYLEVFSSFISRIKETINESNKDEFVIVITGDVVHQKIDISNEQIILVKTFLMDLLEITDVFVIAGNHDMLVNNKDRVDSLTPIIDGIQSDKIHYFKESKCYDFHNLTFVNYSVFEDNRRPDIETHRAMQPNNTFIGLYHAPLAGAKTESGFSGFDYADNVNIFDGCDMVMCGDIHMYQIIEYKIPVVYAGSMIQQNFGENLSGHGFLVWNVETRKHRLIEIPNNNTFVKVKVNSIESLEDESYIIENK